MVNAMQNEKKSERRREERSVPCSRLVQYRCTDVLPGDDLFVTSAPPPLPQQLMSGTINIATANMPQLNTFGFSFYKER